MPELTTEQKSILAEACSCFAAELKKPGPMTEQSYSGIREIIAQLLEQMGPMLVEILIAFLLRDGANVLPRFGKACPPPPTP